MFTFNSLMFNSIKSVLWSEIFYMLLDMEILGFSFRFVLPYKSLVGGVTAIRTDQYTQVNGFSNQFLGWGGEDDDFALRLIANNLSILR